MRRFFTRALEQAARAGVRVVGGQPSDDDCRGRARTMPDHGQLPTLLISAQAAPTSVRRQLPPSPVTPGSGCLQLHFALRMTKK